MNNQKETSKVDNELMQICEPDSVKDDDGQLKATFYFDDLAKKIESEKVKMMDKTLEDIIRYAENIRNSLGL